MNRGFHRATIGRAFGIASGHLEPRQGSALWSPGGAVAALVVVFAMAGRTQADSCFGVAEGSSGSHLTPYPCEWEDHLPVEYWRDHYLHYRRDRYYHHPGTPGCVYLNSTCGPSTATGIAEAAAAPATFALGANYPNPFNSATTIPVSVVAGGVEVNLTIYNISGQPVSHVWNGPLAAGEHRLGWDGRDGHGRPVAAGVYVVRLHQGREMRIRKMVKIE